jgi:phosphonate transport system substrate-binding protein
MKLFLLMTVNILFLTALFGKNLTFGVVPQQSPIKLKRDWQPVIDYLEKATGDTIKLKIERSIPEFEKVLYSGGYDIAYMNPYHYVVAHKKQGYIARVRDEKNVVGILVVRKDSGISDISMLKGKQFLFPSPDAFAATLLNKYELFKKYGINVEHEEKLRYVNSHDSVYKGVARGVGDVGGGVQRTFDDLDDIKAKELLTIIYKTKAYPSHPFAMKPSVSDKTKTKVVKAFMEIPPQLLKSLTIKHLVETKDSDYDAVRDVSKVLPIDVLKIDKSFVDDLPFEADDMAIVTAIIAMGTALGFQILAEGTERIEQIEFLKERGCTMYQGYYKSPPLPAHEFIKLLEQQ